LPRTCRTGQVGVFAGVQLGRQTCSTVMAESRTIADAGQAVRTNRVQVALVQREFGLAVGANVAVLGSGRAARGTMDDTGIVSLRLLDLHQMPAVAPEAAPETAPARVILPLAMGALDE